MRKYILILIGLISLTVYAALPPTQLKGGNESGLATTFNFNLGQIPVTRTGTSVTFGTIPVTQGGTSSTSLTQYSLMSGNGTGAVNMIAPGASGTILFSNGASAFPSYRLLSSDDISASLGYTPAASGVPWAFNSVGINYNSGNVGIGTTAPVATLQLRAPSGYIALPATSGASQTGVIQRISSVGTSQVFDIGYAGGGAGAWFQATSSSNLSLTYPIMLNPNGGRVGIGTTAPTATFDVHASSNPIVQVNNFGPYSSSTGGAVVQMMAASSTGVASGSRLGALQYAGSTQSGTTVAGAYIRSNAIGDWSPTSQGADLTFGVTASGATTRSVALHIQSTTAASFAGQIRAPSLQVSGLSSGVLSTDSSGNVSSSLGTAGQVLLSNGSSTYWGTNAAAPSFTIQNVTSTTTLTTNTHIQASASAGPYTITLPSASSTGFVLTLTKMDSVSHVITLSTQFGQTIESSATSRLNTYGETLSMISSGTMWVPLSRTVRTTPLGSGTITITSTSVNPTKGPSDYDNVYVERISGTAASVKYKFRQGVAGTSGTGDYLITLPFGLRFDPAKVYMTTTANVADTIGQGAFVGTGNISNGSNSGVCFAVAYDATRFRMACTVFFTNYQWWGFGLYALGGSSVGFSMHLQNVDVENWLP